MWFRVSLISVALVSCFVLNANAQDNTRVDPATLKPPPPAVPLSLLKRGVDSLVATPGQSYSAGALHRFLFGDLWRSQWDIPFNVKVLRLDSLGGGLTVQEVSGGRQTLGVRLEGKDGVVWQFRSLVKDPSRGLPGFLAWTPLATAMNDQMAAQFPLAAMVVAELVEAADVLVAKPRPVIMPNDERLGEYRDVFAGRMGWIEVRPEDGKDGAAGFAGSKKIIGSDDIYAELMENPRSYVNAISLLRARLVDLLAGDWDRHSDQWRWARFEDGDRMRWEPIPRDRDWAFAHIDGAVIDLVTPQYYKQYVNFDERYPPITRLTWAAQRVDRHMLTGLDREQFMKVARQVSAKLSDEVLRKAVSVLPPEFAAAGDTLFSVLRERRNKLEVAAADFYALLAREPAVFGTSGSDSAVVTTDGTVVRVQVFETGSDIRMPRFDRTFVRAETKEIRLYMYDGSDRIRITSDRQITLDGGDDAPDSAALLPIVVRVSAGGGDDVITDDTRGNNLFVYNSSGRDSTDLGPDASLTHNSYLTQDTVRVTLFAWGDRDWGSNWLTLPSVDHEPELGFLLGAKVKRIGNGFGQQGCHSCLSFEGLFAFKASEWIGNVEFERLFSPNGWWWTNNLSMYSGRQSRFYGFGNDTPAADSEDPFTGLRQFTELSSGVRYEPASTWNFTAGIAFRRLGDIREGGPIFDAAPYGAGRFEQLTLRTAIEVDRRDNKRLPRAGNTLSLTADFSPSLLDVETPFLKLGGAARWYFSLPGSLEPALHLRAVGEKLWGSAPFEDAPSLGGSSTLPGYPRRQFRGDAMASAGALVRAKALSFKLLTEIDLGLHGVSSVGRVWEAGEQSDTWHTSHGYGIWLHLPAIGRTLSVTAARGRGNKQRIYLDFGFIF